MTDDRAHIDDLAAFVRASPSSFHAVAEAGRRLVEAGFEQLSESDAWPGRDSNAHEARGRRAKRSTSGKFFVIRDGALIAWSVPASATPITPFRIIGAHTDSPGFKLKPKPTTGSFGWLQAGVEIYGGPLYNSWLDRELEFAGRLVFADGAIELVRTGPFLRFPQLAVHLDRAVNADGVKLNPQQHLDPVIGVGEVSGADLVAHLAALVDRPAVSVVGYDIVVADTAAPQVFGLDARLFASGRLDNLSSVHAGLTALIGMGPRSMVVGESVGGGVSTSSTTELATPVEDASAAEGAIAVFAAFDHEEVGSESRSGAAGSFLEDVLTRLAPNPIDRARAFANSWHVSADAGHAIHPNYPERHDPVNRPLVNGGPLLKINANQRYATDALGAAEWRRCCAQAGVNYQEFVSNNAVPCGSTIGPITATRLGIRTIDVGIALLSMHSARELCGVDDPWSLSLAIGAFLSPSDAPLQHGAVEQNRPEPKPGGQWRSESDDDPPSPPQLSLVT